MRQFKRFCAATLLSLALGITAFGGDVQAPAGADPQQPVPVVVPTVTTTATGVSPDTGSATDIFADLTFELYTLVLSVF